MSTLMRLFRNIAINQFVHCVTRTTAPILSRNFHILQSFSNFTKLPTNFDSSTLTRNPQFLNPINLIVNQVAGFKVKGRLKRRCKDCNFIVRNRRLYVICKTHPRHKQMAMRPHDDKFWILTHATQSKVRPY